MIADELAKGRYINDVCLSLRISTFTLKIWRKSDKEFDTMCEAASELVTDSLEQAAIQRGRDGVAEPVVSMGKVVRDPDDSSKMLMTRRYSDGLAQFILKGRRREVYGDKREIDANVGVNLAGSRQSLSDKFAAVTPLVDDFSDDGDAEDSGSDRAPDS